MTTRNTFLEFFAGGGMARLGLGPAWQCLLANDFDSKKCDAYRANFGGHDLIEGDIADIPPESLPSQTVDLVWASFPCQDLSLAGARSGMSGRRSGTFFKFWNHIETLIVQENAPQVIAIENVVGLLTSNDGADFSTISDLLVRAGYYISALVIDAQNFTPQSRPRIFVFGFLNGKNIETCKTGATMSHAIQTAHNNLAPQLKAKWRWLKMPPVKRRNISLSEIIDWDYPDWHSAEKTNNLISMMSSKQKERLDALVRNRGRRAGTAFRRTRVHGGKSIQRLEARFDGIAGCLRTPAGGSSRQIVVAVEDGLVRTRLMTPLEAARLMGLPEHYSLPSTATTALKLCGDGVCVPVVQWIAESIIEPALAKNSQQANKAA